MVDATKWEYGTSTAVEQTLFATGHKGRFVAVALRAICPGMKSQQIEVVWHRTNRGKHSGLMIRCLNCRYCCQLQYSNQTPARELKSVQESLVLWLGGDIPDKDVTTEGKCYVLALKSIRDNLIQAITL